MRKWNWKAMREHAWRSGATRGLTLLFGAVWLTSCAVGPNYKRPELPVTQKFEGAEPALYAQENSVGQFWTQFNDETLNSLVGDALLANHDLRIALANFSESRADRRLTKFDIAPTVTTSLSYTDQRPDPETREFLPGGEFKFYEAGFDAMWELDFFGRIRRNIEAFSADAQSAEANLRNAQVVVIAEVARTYFELRGEQSELDVARRNVENQRATLDLTKARLDAGRGTEFDTSRAQAQLSATLATIGPLEAAVARSIHSLSVLTGREPTALTPVLSAAKDLPPLPQNIAVGNPADLLRRRPDIASSERQLAAATARIGVAVADYFPKVTFTGSIGYASAAGFNGLGADGSGTRLLAPQVSWAAFDLGRVRARVIGARARTDGAFASYEQTVLRALQETEDALVTHARSRDALAHYADSASASRTAAQLARARFDGGLVDFLEVLDAERTQLEAEDQLARSRTDTATSLIAVYKALGGGWEQAPTPGRDTLAVASSSSR